jgi:hypothetical protein
MPSTVVQAMRFDPDHHTLDIAFRGARGTYRYFAVSPDEWNSFRNAPSKGEYLNETFKAKSYRYEKLPTTPNRARFVRPINSRREAADEFFWGDVSALPAVSEDSSAHELKRWIEGRRRPPVQVAFQFPKAA